MSYKDLTGQKFGRLTALEKVSFSGAAKWKCLCECGNTVVVLGRSLSFGNTKSCGCLNKDVHIKHGGSYDALYATWNNMINRCENPNNSIYKYYGERGISVCNQWKDFNNFKQWANITKLNDNLTLDRIDVNGDYCPENCRWVSKKVQANNRRSNLLFTKDNETHTLAEWCELLQLPYDTIQQRITRFKWSFEQAISTPIKSIKNDE